MSSDKIHPEHLGRPPFVYVRQSTFDQVRHHHESRRRQYDVMPDTTQVVSRTPPGLLPG